MRLRRSQLSLKTILLAVAAAATNLAAASLLIAASLTTAFVLGLFGVGVLLPAFWVGAVRRLSYDALLAHIALVGVLVLLFVSAANGQALSALFLAYFAVAVGAPSVAWYFVLGMEAGGPRDRAIRLAIICTKSVTQLTFGLGFWVACLFILRRYGR